MNGTVSRLRGDDLAYTTLDYIRDHPEEWDQRAYFCRTTACFAGRAVLIGLETDLARVPEVLDALDLPDKSDDVHILACQLLGWTDGQGIHVFGCITRDFTELEQAVKDVLNGEVQ